MHAVNIKIYDYMFVISLVVLASVLYQLMHPKQTHSMQYA